MTFSNSSRCAPLAILTLGLPILACSTPSTETGPEAAETMVSGPQIGTWGVDLSGMDTTVRPGDNFYTYVNGTWQAQAEIASDKIETGPSSSLQDLALDQLRVLLDEMAADTTAPEGSDRQKIGDWYATLLDEDRLEELGLSPIQPDLDRIAAIADRTALADLLADNLAGIGTAPLVIDWKFDPEQSGHILVSIATKGMSLPAREMYLDPAYEPVRQLYLEHIARLFALAGFDDGGERAAHVLALETKIAELTWPLAEQRDPRKKHNPTPTVELPDVAPGIDWDRFLERAGVGAPAIVDVSTPSSVAGMTELIAEAPLESWRDYLTYRLIAGVQVALPRAFRDEIFAFYGKSLGGQPEPQPRWKQAFADLGWEEQPLADALGQAFVDAYVPAESRPQVREMIDNLIQAFDARLANLEWMTEETRANARDKLAKTTIKAIYPDVWWDTDGLKVVRGDAIGNRRRGDAFMRQRNLSFLEEYPDRAVFWKPVYEVNAYANPSWAEVVFLAAIVRPPFFDPAADPAVNYGAMGAVIGHEVSHLFDDQGRLWDGDGLLRDWWTAADAEKFVAATNKLAEQVGSYEPLPGQHINGRLTLGESIADVAGLTVAYDAFQLYLDGREPEVIDGFTADQRFFLAYAQMWRWKPRDEYLDRLLKTDFHPPTHFRPMTVRNIDAWYDAFDAQPGDALYLAPEDRLNPW